MAWGYLFFELNTILVSKEKKNEMFQTKWLYQSRNVLNCKNLQTKTKHRVSSRLIHPFSFNKQWEPM